VQLEQREGGLGLSDQSLDGESVPISQFLVKIESAKHSFEDSGRPRDEIGDLPVVLVLELFDGGLELNGAILQQYLNADLWKHALAVVQSCEELQFEDAV
jgi:hypothetical protein